MSILTAKMKAARSDHYGANCKLWLPCNETSGNNLVERVTGLVFAGSVASGYATAHGVNFLTAGNAPLAALANIAIPKQGVMMMVQKVGTSYALTNAVLGDSNSGPNVNLNGASVSITIPGASTITANMSQTAAATNIICAVAAWDTSNLYAYEGLNADAALISTTALPAAMKTALAANTKVAGSYTINAAVQSVIYGAVLFDFSASGLPSDLLTGINAMRADWIQGRKQLYAGWKDRY